MPLTKLEVKEQFVWKRDVLRRKIEEFLAKYGSELPADERAEMGSVLYTLFDMHTEIANASMLEVLQAAAEVGFAMSAPMLGDVKVGEPTAATDTPDATA